MSPRNENELMRMVKSAASYGKPAAIRYPKAEVPYFAAPEEDGMDVIGEGEFEVIIDVPEGGNVIVSLGAPHTEIIMDILCGLNDDACEERQKIGLINASVLSPVSKKLTDRRFCFLTPVRRLT